MKRYRNDAGTPTRTDFGVGLVAGLQAFPQTSALAPAFEQLNDDLCNAHAARREARKVLIKARVALRLAKYRVDQTIRAIHGALESADGGRTGAATGELFPGGLTPVIAPRGTGQIAPAEDLVRRFVQSKLPGVVAIGERWCPKLNAGIAKLKAAAAAHKAADQAYVNAFKVELCLRTEHARQIDRLMGLVRAAFPFNKTKQEMVFPELDEEPPVSAAVHRNDGLMADVAPVSQA